MSWPRFDPTCWRWRRYAARYHKLGERLPALLEEVTLACHESDAAGRAEWFALLFRLHFAAHSLAYKLGYGDLAAVVEERLRWSAELTGDQLMLAIATYVRTNSLLCAGNYDVGLRLMDRTRASLSDGMERAEVPMLDVYGSTHLRSAILAARANDAALAWEHIEAAREIVARIGARPRRAAATSGALSFGAGNTDIHAVAVAVAVELGDGAAAISGADRITLPAGLPKSRYGHHFLDLSRAYLWQGDRAKAQRAVEKARAYAPSQARHHPTTREVTRMLVRQQRRANESLTRLAEWVGVDT